MKIGNSEAAPPYPFYRCAGPNCGQLKNASDRWWLMWTSIAEFKQPVLYLSSWDDDLAQLEGTLHVCGELCAQKLQSQFMGNIRESQLRRIAEGS
ncbi:MAG: hypothetical protein JST79_02785 [Acidobacteria bacterium]|nr:hypothetical protein [Acidobacteriota bacterium]